MSDPTTPHSPRDVSRLDPTDLTHRPFPGSVQRQGDAFPVVVGQSVLNDIHRHGQSVERIEVCGVLVGNVFRDPAGAYLHIDASIRGDHAASASTSVTFTAETWTHIQEILELDHPGKRIVGWYHTHPDFGIFLSDMDVFICENFFGMPWQVAYVFDPVRLQDGCFVWKEGKPTRQPMTVDPDAAPAVAVTAAPDTKGGEPTSNLADVQHLHDRIRQLEQMQKSLIAGLVVVGVLAVLLPILIYALTRDPVASAEDIPLLPSVPTTMP